ncbi:hypothetical protein QYE76_035081 [Lolium multiflorum]|uniref:Transposase (putative) gypsy type domain-containing protein n=1 Tax=Lolium multiflorum TaxID=4521 RepID=A0AAD8QYJ4_LOLMU|nr:hypothetical protein QYE76_035081 [Lolium multiflorum]
MATEDLKLSKWERSKISNQDANLLKKLGFMKKEKMLIFPGKESFPTPRIGYRLHQLTPNSILHISIFITLYECFLGTPPNWGPWKRIFLVRRNSSHNTAYNMAFIHEEHVDSQEYNVAPFDGSEKILRRRSWDAEATDEEKTATEALMKRIHELQNTRGKELSGIQITAYFLRIRVQPLQARKNPLWMYNGDKDVDRFSKDLSVKDLESCPEDFVAEQERHHSNLVGDEEEEPTVNVTAPTSTSQTLVLSETRPTTEETLPPQRDIGHSTPVGSPSAPSPKRARVELGKEPSLLIGSSVTPSMDDPLMKEFIRLGTQFIGYRDYADNLKEALAKANKRADDLALSLEQSEKTREKAELDAASVESLRKRLHEAETALSDNTAQQIAREGDIIARLESQNRRFVRKMSQDFQLEKPEDDRLLDALSLLEIHGDEVRHSTSDAKTAFSRLFPYFFPKKEQPDTFATLIKHFIPEEDLWLTLRQENLKIGVEGTIALVAKSQQNIGWAKVGEVKKMKTERWQSLIRATKPHSKKILSFLGYTPAPSSSSAKPEVK